MEYRIVVGEEHIEGDNTALSEISDRAVEPEIPDGQDV
jgi:hypothetical protein